MITGLSTEIINILDALCEKFGLAVDWTTTNIMPYMETLCSKIINYEIATSVVYIVIGIAICVACLALFKIIHKNTEFGITKYEVIPDDYFIRFGTCLIIGVIFLIGLHIIFGEVFDIIACYTLPEKLLIEELSSIYNQIK